MPRYFKTMRVVLGLGLLLGSLQARAAHQLPPKLLHSGPDEQTAFVVDEGQRSLREKLRAGEERFALRQGFRAELVKGIRANAASRRDYKTNDAYPALARLRARSELVWLPWALLACLGGAWFTLQWCRTGQVRLLPPRT